MFKKKEDKVTTTKDVMGGRTVVTKTVETRTTADGKVTTTTKEITTIDGEDMESSFKNLDLFGNARLSGQITAKKIIHTSNVHEQENGHDERKKSSSKSLSERLGLKVKPKSKDSKAVGGSSATPTTVDITAFEQDGLKSHNSYRAKHGVPPLKLSKQLCSYSKQWADHLAATNTFEHRTERKYGENIYTKWSSNPNHSVSGNEAVESWYSEIKDHTFGREPTSLKSGHFTQVIWKESKEVGIGMARSSKGSIYVVANYDPPGNFIGKFAENVPPPKK